MNRKEIAILALITLLTVITWMIFDLRHAKNTSTITEENIKQVIPLTPTFDSDIIKNLYNREE